jgi:hypothetical protein
VFSRSRGARGEGGFSRSRGARGEGVWFGLLMRSRGDSGALRPLSVRPARCFSVACPNFEQPPRAIALAAGRSGAASIASVISSIIPTASTPATSPRSPVPQFLRALRASARTPPAFPPRAPRLRENPQRGSQQHHHTRVSAHRAADYRTPNIGNHDTRAAPVLTPSGCVVRTNDRRLHPGGQV